jgi:Matrixin
MDGSPSFNAVAEEALNIWNQHLIHMKFAANRGSILPPDGNDANTSVTMASTIYGETFGKGVLAVTLLSPRGTTFVEADVIFNIGFNWDSYRGPLFNDTEDFRRVALHEFGHVLGLDHPDQAGQSVAAVMNSTISDTDTLQSDDIFGAKSIYDSGPPFLTSNPAPNLVNLSTRAFVGTGERNLIGGFIIQGSQPATVILRAIGNSLPALGITNALSDPLMDLHASSGAIIATSDDWIESADASTIASYRLDPTNSRESAILATLNPGAYTFVVQAFDNQDGNLTGTAIVELYDLHTTGGRAANISTRGQVLQGDQVLIGGFIVGGNQSKTVIVRALGPSLGAQGVTSPLADPNLELRDAAGSLLASNNNWGDGPNAAQIQSEGFAPSQPAEAAVRATLSPGNYTAVVRSANGGTGIGLVEVYDLSPAPN